MLVAFVPALVGCNSILGLNASVGRFDARPYVDAQQFDGPPLPPCSPSVPFSIGPTRIAILSNPAVGYPAMSNDAKELWYVDENTNPLAIMYTTRGVDSDPFGAPATASFDDPASDDREPSITQDGLELVFASNRLTMNQNFTLFVATRSSAGAAWSNPSAISSFSSTYVNNGAAISADGLSLYFNGFGGTAGNEYVLTRASRTDAWGNPANAKMVATNVTYAAPSFDQLELYFWPLADETSGTTSTHRQTRSATTTTFQSSTDQLVSSTYTYPMIAVDSTDLLFVDAAYDLAFMHRDCAP